MKDDQIYLSHIAECIQYIEQFTQGGHDEFEQSPLIQHAVIRNLEVIGEATKHLSATTRQAHPEIPWRQVAGLRDVLIHDYMDIDLTEVWNVVEHELPTLKQAVNALIDAWTETDEER